MVISKAALRRLADADWLRNGDTQLLFKLLDGDDQRTRAVGGVVRDTLLGRERDSADIDFATELTPDEVVARAAKAGLTAHPTGIEHGTVTIRVGTILSEVTTLREDVETDGRHAVVKFGTDWRRDAERRDFTLNALYLASDGTLFDPIEGAEDCLAGRVRFIGDADRRLAEDRLRAYRFFRFSASHGNETLDREGLAAVTRAAGAMGQLSAERVGGEMRRMLGLPKVGNTLKAMVEAELLALPPAVLDDLIIYERRARRPDRIARLALILSKTGVEPLKDRWRLANDEITNAEAILRVAALLMDFDVNEAAYRFPASIADGVDIAAVLAGWTEAGKSAVLEQLQGLDVPRFPLTGGDLIARGFHPGKALGTELERLERKWIESGFVLDRQRLLSEIRR